MFATTFARGRIVPILCAASLWGCSDRLTGLELLGLWGGEGIEVVLDGTGGILEFDCALGTFEAPLAPDGEGVFTLDGTFTPGQGGPVPDDGGPPPEPTRWSGEIDGDRMFLRGVTLESGVLLGPYTLRKDLRGTLRRCL